MTSPGKGIVAVTMSVAVLAGACSATSTPVTEPLLNEAQAAYAISFGVSWQTILKNQRVCDARYPSQPHQTQAEAKQLGVKRVGCIVNPSKDPNWPITTSSAP